MLISHDGYQKLAAVDTNMVREYLIEQQCIDINNQMKQHLLLVLFNINEYANNIIENIDLNNTKDRNAIYRSIRSLLMVLVPVLTTSNPVVLRTGDKINIKVGGDGRNISKKQSHIILAISILNEENYNSLNCVYQKFTQELEELKSIGFVDNLGTVWLIEFFFSGDWKFLALVLELNAANSNYFCLFCNCHENECTNMELNWNNGSNTQGRKHLMLFEIIDQSN
ncbi:21924_t:CDS:2 [Cetraspora pellucida]|uniref:21924_t:CDS:1 n=1 Tax=Cetraspora pellucida TaxID=1433469 RepID=A0A9N9J716_9GLOM|nr:21924_t:CDS:2 [Cetraspora pellucida]